MIPGIRTLSSVGFHPFCFQSVIKGRFICERRFFSNKTDKFIKENSSNVGSPEIPLPGTEENKAMLSRISVSKLQNPRTNPFTSAMQNINIILQTMIELQQDNIKVLNSASSVDRKLKKLITLAAKHGIVNHKVN